MKKLKKAVTALVTSVMMVSAVTLTGCSIVSSKTVTEEKDFSELFSKIKIDVVAEDVRIHKSEDDECHVKFTHDEGAKTTIKVDKDTLVVSERMRFTLFSFTGKHDELTLDVYLPESEYKDIDINVTSSDVVVVDGIDFDTVDIDSVSGDVNISVMTPDVIKVDTTSGEIQLSNISCGSVDVNTVSGDVQLKAMNSDLIDVDTTSGEVSVTESTSENFVISTVSGEVSFTEAIGIKVKVSTISGDVRFDAMDGNKFNIDTVSGDVKGNLRTGKDFDISTLSGKIDIPEDGDNGVFKADTTSGSVKIDIE